MVQSEESNRPRVWPSLTVGIGALAVAAMVSNLALYIIIIGELTVWPISMGIFGVILMGVSCRLRFRRPRDHEKYS